MPINIKTNFTPLRMNLSRREAVELCVSLTNEGKEGRKLTIKTVLPGQLSFDKSGYRDSELDRIDSIEPEEEKRFYYKIYSKPATQKGEQTIKIKVQEHYQNYQYTQNQYEKDIELSVYE